MRGTINNVEYTEGSGIAVVVFKTGERIPVDAGPFFRASRLLGDLTGREVEYELTAWGTLAGVWLPETEEG